MTLEVHWEAWYGLEGQGWMLSKIRQVFAFGGPAHLVQKHRLGRLLDPPHDETLGYINGDGRKVLPPRIYGLELLVDSRIDDRRQEGLLDPQLVAWVFTAEDDNDNGSGSFTHNYMMSAGEDDAAFEQDGRLKPGKHPKTFVQQAMDLFG